MPGHPGHRLRIDKLDRRIPGLWMVVHVQHLERRGRNEVSPAGQDTGRLGSADCLAAAEDDQVGTTGCQPPKVLAGREFARGIDQQR